MAVAGSLTYDTKIDKNGFEKGLSSIKNVASTSLKTIGAGIATATTAIVGLAAKSVSAYAEYEQLVGGVDTLFKDSSQKLQNYANEAYKTAGLSANEYMSTVTSFSASLLQSLGGDTEKSADYANQAIIDMSDNANKMGTSMESIQYAYQGFAKQNYTMLDNLKLGYGGTKEEMQRLLEDASKISGIKYDISSFADVTQAIHVMQESMGIAGTTAKEASTTIEGSMNSMKSAWKNLLTGIADDNANFEQLISNFVNSVVTVGNNLIPRIKTVINGLGKLVSGLVEEFLPSLLQEIPPLITDMLPIIISAFQTLIQSIISILPQLADGFVAVIPQLVDALLQSLPLLIDAGLKIIESLIIGIGQALPQILVSIYQVINLIVGTLVDNIPLLINSAIQFFMAIIQAIPLLIQALTENLAEIINTIIYGLTDAIPTIIDGAIQLFMAIVEAIPVIINALIENLPYIIQTILEAFIDNFPEILDGAIQLFNALIQAIPTIIQALIANLPRIINTITTTLINNLPLLIKASITLFMGLIKAIPTIISTLARNLPQIISSIVSGLIQGIPKLFEVGENLIKGLWNGMGNLKNWIVEKVKELARGILDGMKSALGIHSPSKLFKDEVGRFIPQGVAVGIEADTDSALKAIDNMNDDIISEMNKAVAYETGSINAKASVKSNNSMLNVIQASISLDGSVEIDGQKAGKLMTPYITKTLRTGGAT